MTHVSLSTASLHYRLRAPSDGALGSAFTLRLPRDRPRDGGCLKVSYARAHELQKSYCGGVQFMSRLWMLMLMLVAVAMFVNGEGSRERRAALASYFGGAPSIASSDVSSTASASR